MSEPNLAPAMTVRAMVSGTLVGVLLCASNLYLQLKLGFSDSGNIAAVLLGFGLMTAVARARPSTLFENQVTQTLAVVMGAAGTALVGSLAALHALNALPAPWVLVAWLAVLGSIGVVLGLQSATRLINTERLPFPTGIAAAEVATAIHRGPAEARSRVRAILVGALPAVLVTWLRDARGAVPGMVALPGTWLGKTSEVWGFGASVSPALLGTGALIGLNAGLSLLLGTAVCWLCAVPLLLSQGLLTADADFGGWLVWPGTAMILGSSVASLFGLRAALLSTFDAMLKGLRGGPRASRTPALLLALFVAAGVMGKLIFGGSMLALVVALFVSAILASVIAHAAGKTDIAPIGPLGQAAMVVFVMVGVSQATELYWLASVVTVVGTQIVVSLWCLKSGSELGLEVRRQYPAQLLGAVVGAVVAVALFLLFHRAYGLGSAQLPAPGVAVFRTFADALLQGGARVPAYAGFASALAFAVGLGLSLMPRRAWLPSPVAVGTAFFIPPAFAVTVALGSVLGALTERRAKGAQVTSLASGAIAGESLSGVVIAGLRVLGVI